jgi:hypothetical protein
MCHFLHFDRDITGPKASVQCQCFGTGDAGSAKKRENKSPSENRKDKQTAEANHQGGSSILPPWGCRRTGPAAEEG